MNIMLDFFVANFTILDLLVSLLINCVTVWSIIHFFYYPKGQRRDYYFTFILLSVSIFMLIYLFMGQGGTSDISDAGMVGAALGLFAIFGIIRYRTESVPIREMTYLFFLIALSVLNGRTGALTFLDQIIINVVFIGVVWLAENFHSAYNQGCKYVKYDNIELIKPERHDELVKDLEERLGLKVTRVEVGSVDFLTDMAMLRVFYVDPCKRIKSVDRLLKLPLE
jgi:hypothetical protein